MKQLNNLIILTGILIVFILPISFPYSETEQILTNWSYPNYQDNQLIWEAKGKTAVVREDEFIISVFELTYYLQPLSTTSSSEVGKKEKIHIQADMAILKKQTQTASLHENIILKRISEPTDESNETMQARTLFINLANKTFSTDSPVTISRSDIIVKSKGCEGDLYFNSVLFVGDVETVIKNCNSNSFSLGAIFSPKSHIDTEELNKTSSVITITSEGPLSVKKNTSQEIPLPLQLKQTNHSKKTAQTITFQNKVKVNSFTRQSPSPLQIKLQAENLILLLSGQENPVTKRNATYLINLSATGSVKIDDSFQSAECSSLVYDEVAGSIILKGNEKSLATIIKPLNPISNTNQAKNNSYINLSAQTIKIQTEKDKLLLIGCKEIVFSDESICSSSKPTSGTEAAITDTSSTSNPNRQTSPLSTKIQITADNNALVSFNDNQIYLENKVRIFQNVKTSNPLEESGLKTQIQCDKLTINWNSSVNSLQKIKAEKNIIIVSADGGTASGEILEWTPDLCQINIKSPRRVKIWHKNNLMEADEITITTNPQTPGYIGDWNKIETKNNNGGKIKINPPEKE